MYSEDYNFVLSKVGFGEGGLWKRDSILWIMSCVQQQGLFYFSLTFHVSLNTGQKAAVAKRNPNFIIPPEVYDLEFMGAI